MKTRIISGIVMALILAAVLTVGLTVWPPIIPLFVALICGIGTYEMLKNAAGIESKTAVFGGSIFAAVYSTITYDEFAAFILYVVYILFAAVVILIKHKEFTIGKIAIFTVFPMILGYAFYCVGAIAESGVYYLLLLLNFSSVCDMGAYFSGVTLGKHKLCPEISPKKTVEGAVGGIVSSVIVALIIVFSFGNTDKLLGTLIATVPLCIVGMIGDLFASAIKRSVNLKDYGNLIPGHGGVLDRVDSILLIAPVMFILEEFGVL